MAIRYHKKLNQEINRTIKNFNQKIARLEKQERELLPSKITKQELKNTSFTRAELQRKLKELQRFSKRGAEDIIETKGDVKLTQYRQEVSDKKSFDDKMIEKFEKAMIQFKDMSNNQELNKTLDKLKDAIYFKRGSQTGTQGLKNKIERAFVSRFGEAKAFCMEKLPPFQLFCNFWM